MDAGPDRWFFHGYYRHYCYLPLYIFSWVMPGCGNLPISMLAAGSVRIVGRI